MKMKKTSNKAILNQKEQMIQQLLALEFYKASDDRQLYELTLRKLEKEYKGATDH
ncbi:Fur-regulated basic protein FbpA [Bacillus sp. SA1-12]|uniref:Fur-regulated basic protein FbpA n=1 Tax=Bacillus sp. SA1-12 TaxID=1455638 RepID=UPI000A07C981|nr:Fur-regulated basic protein FbpA [Bacillus sp. SA1-12]